MADMNDVVRTVRDSVSTVFRHIFPGVLILLMGTFSNPSYFEKLKVDTTASIIVIGAIAMVIGNVWYVFHRYFILQFVDWLAYVKQCPGSPTWVDKCNYRTDLSVHVSKFFAVPPQMVGMSRHIRDRFSSFNYMYIVAEALLIFTLIAEDKSFFRAHQWEIAIVSFLAFSAATWQYLIVRVIDMEFRNYASKLIPEKETEEALVRVGP